MRDPQEIMEMIRVARECGCKLIDIDGVAYHLGEKPLAHAKVPEMKAEDLIKAMNPLDDFTEEEIKYWATPRYDEIQEEKAKRAQALKDGEINA